MLTSYHVAVKDYKESGKTLLRSTLSGVAIQIADDFYRRLKKGGGLSDHLLPEVRDLMNRHFLVPDRKTDIERALAKIRKKMAQTDLMSVTLMMTGACNMECKYCFQNNLLEARSPFGEDLVEPLIKWVTEACTRTKTRSFMLHLYGGEPLLNFPLVEKVIRGLRPRLSEKKVTWNLSITTNGSLMTREIADRLAQSGCSLAIISLDGPRAIHDYRRPMTGLRHSSFDKVIEGIKNALRRFDVMIRTNIDSQNVEYIEELIDYLVSDGIAAHPRFYFSLEVVGPVFHATRHVNSHLLSIKESGKVVQKLLEIQHQRGIRVFGNMPSEVSCEHIMTNTYTVSNTGKIFSCPGFVGFDDFCIGTISDGLNDRLLNRLFSIRPWENEKCLRCPYLPQCHGGCRSCAVITEKDDLQEAYKGTYCRRAFFDATFPSFLRKLFNGEEEKFRPLLPGLVSNLP